MAATRATRATSATSAATSQRETNTATQILDVAERLVQSRGFNGFSYADVAGELGITKAALHYHYPGKAELGEALIVRYGGRFDEALAAIDAGDAPAPRKLAAYADLYRRVLSHGRMCLCGMLAAEYATLPEAMRERVRGFLDRNEAWLARVLAGGRTDGSLAFSGPPEDLARTIVASLEGALLVARPFGDVGRFDAAVARMLATLVVPLERADAS